MRQPNRRPANSALFSFSYSLVPPSLKPFGPCICYHLQSHEGPAEGFSNRILFTFYFIRSKRSLGRCLSPYSVDVKCRGRSQPKRTLWRKWAALVPSATR